MEIRNLESVSLIEATIFLKKTKGVLGGVIIENFLGLYTTIYIHLLIWYLSVVDHKIIIYIIFPTNENKYDSDMADLFGGLAYNYWQHGGESIYE